MNPSNLQIRCASCGRPFNATVHTVIDAQHDPQSKAMLIAGYLNVFDCPHCGFGNRVSVPLLYHDAEKSLLIAYIPMEVSLRSGKSDEQIVGDLLKELTRILPKDQFRAYMFNPKRALTMEGLREQVMAAEGITKDMIDASRKRAELIQSLLTSDSEDALRRAIEAADDQIDDTFFSVLAAMYQRLMAEGKTQLAASLEMLQERLLLYSTRGKHIVEEYQKHQQVVDDVMFDLNKLPLPMTRAELRKLALKYEGDSDRLQLLVSFVRSVMDDQFFQEFTRAISEASAERRPMMEAVRDELLRLTQEADEAEQAEMDEMTALLDELIKSPNPDALIERERDMIKPDMLHILSDNIQKAQQRGDTEAAEAMRRIFDKLLAVVREQTPAEIRFLSEWLSAQPAEDPVFLERSKQFNRNDLRILCSSMIDSLKDAEKAADLVKRLQAIRDQL
jgi:hypothetical protein